MNPKYQQRRGTAAKLIAANELPLAGQIYFETDSNRLKVGDGVRRYNDLPYLTATPTISEVVGLTSALAGKQAAGSYAALVHGHAANEITGLATVATTGSYNDLANTPTIPSVYTLPTASASVLGGVKIGSGISIDGSGVISASAAYTLPAATASTLGGVIVGTGIGVTSGTVSVTYGTTAGTACQGNDSRLSDARVPNSHTHGNITNAGAIGTTSGLPVITTTSGVLTTGTFGTTAGTFCQGSDARLSDSRVPTAHTHAAADIVSGVIAAARLGTGTADSTTFLRGDGTWQVGTGGSGSGITQADADVRYVNVAGDTMTGALTVDGNLTVGTTALSDSLRYFDIYNTGAGLLSGSILRLVTQNVAGTANAPVNLVKYRNGVFAITNVDSNAAACIVLQVGSVEGLRLTSVGNVGIGTSVPATKLHVSDTAAAAQILVTSANTSTGAVLFGDTDSNLNAGRIQYNHQFDVLQLFANGSEKVRVTDTAMWVYPAGSAALPAIANGNDSNTGLWFPAADTIAVSTGGVERLRIDSTGAASVPGSLTVGGSAVVVTSDARLTDARSPLSHVHGNITNAGAIGSTAGLPIVTTTGGVLTVGAFGTSAGSFCQGNDARLSDARSPLSHAHGNITNAGAIGSASGQIVVTGTSGALTTAASIASTQVTGLATVATTNDYNDLINKPPASSRALIFALN